MDFTETDIATLGDKLDAMDLTGGEHAALVAVFEAAADQDVAGFAYDLNPNDLSFKAGAELSFKALAQKTVHSSSLQVDGVMGPKTQSFHMHQNP